MTTSISVALVSTIMNATCDWHSISMDSNWILSFVNQCLFDWKFIAGEEYTCILWLFME